LKTISLTKTKYNWKSPIPPDRLTVHRSALAYFIITDINFCRAQYSTGRQSWLSNEDRVSLNCAVGMLDQKVIN